MKVSFATKTLWQDMLLIFSRNKFQSEKLADYLSEILVTIKRCREEKNTRTVARKIPTLDAIFEEV